MINLHLISVTHVECFSSRITQLYTKFRIIKIFLNDFERSLMLCVQAILIGRTFYGLTPSTDDINTYTFRPLRDCYRDVKRLSTSITKCFWTKSPTLPLRNISYPCRKGFCCVIFLWKLWCTRKIRFFIFIFLHQGHIKLIKGDINYIYNVTKDVRFKLMLSLNFLFIKESWKKNTTVFTKQQNHF